MASPDYPTLALPSFKGPTMSPEDLMIQVDLALKPAVDAASAGNIAPLQRSELLHALGCVRNAIGLLVIPPTPAAEPEPEPELTVKQQAAATLATAQSDLATAKTAFAPGSPMLADAQKRADDAQAAYDALPEAAEPEPVADDPKPEPEPEAQPFQDVETTGFIQEASAPAEPNPLV